MPAISPARLKKDVSNLLEKLNDLDVFERELEHLLEFYADRTVRPSQAGMPASLLPSYHVPRPVLRELSVGLARRASLDPDTAISLAHRLWIQGVYESMLLSIRLLDSLPDAHSPVVMRNLKNWMQATEDSGLLTAIFRTAVRRDAEDVLAVLESLLESRVEMLRGTALVGLAVLAELAPLSVMVRRPKMVSLLRELAARSPAETAFFMRQHYLISMQPEVARLLRRCLPVFPEDMQVELRRMLREN